MSVETELHASLLAHAPLAALIGTRLAPDKIAQGEARPYIVYVVGREPTYHLDGTLATTLYTVRLQCWGDTRAQAEAVADALEAALLASTVEAGGIPIEERQTLAEHELDLEATEIVCEIWRDA
ncbi:MAG: DUF3168 domain-containing protein [Pseudomonadota bacterium]